MSLGDGLDGTENLTTPGFDPQTIHPVAGRYADCAVLTAIVYSCLSVCTADRDSGVRHYYYYHYYYY